MRGESEEKIIKLKTKRVRNDHQCHVNPNTNTLIESDSAALEPANVVLSRAFDDQPVAPGYRSRLLSLAHRSTQLPLPPFSYVTGIKFRHALLYTFFSNQTPLHHLSMQPKCAQCKLLQNLKACRKFLLTFRTLDAVRYLTPNVRERRWEIHVLRHTELWVRQQGQGIKNSSLSVSVHLFISVDDDLEGKTPWWQRRKSRVERLAPRGGYGAWPRLRIGTDWPGQVVCRGGSGIPK